MVNPGREHHVEARNPLEREGGRRLIPEMKINGRGFKALPQSGLDTIRKGVSQETEC
jgi:hypothetical protein